MRVYPHFFKLRLTSVNSDRVLQFFILYFFIFFYVLGYRPSGHWGEECISLLLFGLRRKLPHVNVVTYLHFLSTFKKVIYPHIVEDMVNLLIVKFYEILWISLFSPKFQVLKYVYTKKVVKTVILRFTKTIVVIVCSCVPLWGKLLTHFFNHT